MSNNLTTWLEGVPNYRFVPLFDVNDRLEVKTKIQNVSGYPRRLLCRSLQMEEAVIEIVETGIPDPNWQGLFYIMGIGELKNFEPRYVGKAEKKGINRELSANLVNLKNNKHMFARWGDGVAYHIGDLSHVLFRFPGYTKPSMKYERWVESLFCSRDPPILREMTFLYLGPWYKNSVGPSGLTSGLPGVEHEIIYR